ncbi:hypothetical protein A2U01_0000211 [Trifolium medium]|uniref:Uncharacterized protein n=1 Tax=Trifolium medium TaxID=97028 RepID=A0A392LWY5_9FABA|nr:hypothetical protein [Trifolium medium]
MQAAISSKVLGRIKFEHIASTNLTNLASSSIDPFVMYREKIDREHCSHIAVILKFHVKEQHDSV